MPIIYCGTCQPQMKCSIDGLIITILQSMQIVNIISNMTSMSRNQVKAKEFKKFESDLQDFNFLFWEMLFHQLRKMKENAQMSSMMLFFCYQKQCIQIKEPIRWMVKEDKVIRLSRRIQSLSLPVWAATETFMVTRNLSMNALR